VNTGDLRFRFIDRLTLIEGETMAQIIQHSDLPAQCNLEILEALRLSKRIAARFAHRLMRVLDGVDVLAQAPFKYFGFAGADGIASEAEEDFGYGDVGLGSIDWISHMFKLVSLKIQTGKAFIELSLKGSCPDGAGTDGKDDQQ